MRTLIKEIRFSKAKEELTKKSVFFYKPTSLDAHFTSCFRSQIDVFFTPSSRAKRWTYTPRPKISSTSSHCTSLSLKFKPNLTPALLACAPKDMSVARVTKIYP